MTEDLPELPSNAPVWRANGDVLCQRCRLPFYMHPQYRYPDGESTCVRGCDGKFRHL